MKDILKRLIPYIIIVLMVSLIRQFVITPVIVSGISMQPLLEEREILILHKVHRKIDRFDIVVVEMEGQRLVKRVVGLPGEHLEYKNRNLYIDGERVEEDFETSETFDFSIEWLGYNSIPENEYFVIGDNRESSLDSRVLGPVEKGDVIGMTKLRVSPITRFGNLK